MAVPQDASGEKSPRSEQAFAYRACQVELCTTIKMQIKLSFHLPRSSRLAACCTAVKMQNGISQETLHTHLKEEGKREIQRAVPQLFSQSPLTPDCSSGLRHCSRVGKEDAGGPYIQLVGLSTASTTFVPPHRSSSLSDSSSGGRLEL